MSELDPEDQKLVTLARSARARTGAAQGAAVRDTDGRTYVAATVDRPALRLSALQLAVGMAISSGALGLEAAVVLGESGPDRSGAGEARPGEAGTGEVGSDGPVDEAGVAALRDLAPNAALFFAAPDGTVA